MHKVDNKVLTNALLERKEAETRTALDSRILSIPLARSVSDRGAARQPPVSIQEAVCQSPQAKAKQGKLQQGADCF